MSEPVIDIRDLHRDFVVRRPVSRLRREKRVVRAVDGITFSVAAGECVGYIGANGAGKSTTIKMLTGILVPTSGYVRVAGLEPVRQRRHWVFLLETSADRNPLLARTQIEVMRTAQFAGILVLNISRPLERVGRAAQAAARRRGFSFWHSHGTKLLKKRSMSV